WPSPDVGGQSRIRRFASGVHSECAPDRKRDKSPSASSLPADTAWDEGRPSARWRENPPPIALRASWPRAEIPHQFPAAHPVTAPTSAPPAPPATAHRGDVFCWSDFHWQLATGYWQLHSTLRSPPASSTHPSATRARGEPDPEPKQTAPSCAPEPKPAPPARATRARNSIQDALRAES